MRLLQSNFYNCAVNFPCVSRIELVDPILHVKISSNTTIVQ
jgi:hypothetical protein